MDIRESLSNHIALGNTQTAVAKATGLSSATISQWLHGKYEGTNERIDELVRNYLNKTKVVAVEISNYKRDFDFVKTSIYKEINAAANLALARGELRVVVGDSGVGKTTAIKKIKALDPTIIFVEAYRGIRKNRFLSKLAISAEIKCKGTFDDAFEKLCENLNGTSRLIIVDEAEHLPLDALDALRRINDFTGCGVVLVGLPIFYDKLKLSQSDYAYIYNRTTLPLKLGKLTLSDVDELVSTMVVCDVPTEVWYKCCAGVGRDLKIIVQDSLRVANLNKVAPLSAEFENVVMDVTKQLGRVYR